MILLVPLAMLAVYKLSWPKTTVFLVAFLWLVVALFMLLGTGEQDSGRVCGTGVPHGRF